MLEGFLIMACAGLGLLYLGARARAWAKTQLYEREVKAHAHTKETHEIDLQRIANLIAPFNVRLEVNGREYFPETCGDRSEWPDILEKKK